jgi:hypothetical protein
MASVLVLIAALLLVRASAAATSPGASSEVCVPGAPVGASCTSTTSSTRSSSTTRSSTQSSSTVSTSTTGTQTETSTSTASSTTTSATGSSTTTTTSTSTATSSGGRSAALASPSPSPSHFPPPPPPLPPPSPGSTPVPPEAVVQRIVMVPAVSGPIAPGDTVEVQATLEAQRGTDIFAVPHVPVTFTIVAARGNGAAVTPARGTSGESGVAMARVRTGDLPGDTVISATSGTASAQLALHADLPVTGAAAHLAPPATSGDGSGSSGGHRVALVGLLAALGILGAAGLGLARRPRHR